MFFLSKHNVQQAQGNKINKFLARLIIYDNTDFFPPRLNAKSYAHIHAVQEPTHLVSNHEAFELSITSAQTEKNKAKLTFE